MTSISRLTQKPKPIDGDLVAIWDSESSRTRSVNFKSIKEFMIYVSDLTLDANVLTVHYSDGTTKELNL